jgi:hypothetical protein
MIVLTDYMHSLVSIVFSLGPMGTSILKKKENLMNENEYEFEPYLY